MTSSRRSPSNAAGAASSWKLSRSLFAPLTALDWLLILLLGSFLLANCVVHSQHRLLWSDELLAARITGDTFPSMVRGWWWGADGGPPLFYLGGWLLQHLFGHAELSLRLFSAAGMGIAATLLWAAARRYAGTLPVAVAVATCFLLPSYVRWQEVNGRFYGLFFATAALASLMFLITAECEPTTATLLCLALSHAALLGSHTLGIVYSFSLIAGTVVLDRSYARWRPKLYLAALAGWLVLPLCYHALRQSSWVAPVTFWTVKPNHHEFLLGLTAFSPALLHLSPVFLLLAAGRLYFTGAWRQIPRGPLALCAALVLAQTILFLKSQTGISIYSDRYLLPLLTVTILSLAGFLQLVLPRKLTLAMGNPGAAVVALAVMIPCCVFAFRQQDLYWLYPRKGLVERLTAGIPNGSPVLTTSLPPFLLLSHYDSDRRVLYLLDTKRNLGGDTPSGDFYTQRLLTNWTRAGYNTQDLLPCHVLMSSFPDFYVLADPSGDRWIGTELRNAGYSAQKIGTIPEWYAVTLWHIRQTSSSRYPC